MIWSDACAPGVGSMMISRILLTTTLFVYRAVQYLSSCLLSSRQYSVVRTSRFSPMESRSRKVENAHNHDYLFYE